MMIFFEDDEINVDDLDSSVHCERATASAGNPKGRKQKPQNPTGKKKSFLGDY